MYTIHQFCYLTRTNSYLLCFCVLDFMDCCPAFILWEKILFHKLTLGQRFINEVTKYFQDFQLKVFAMGYNCRVILVGRDLGRSLIQPAAQSQGSFSAFQPWRVIAVCPGSGQEGLVFAVSRRAHLQDPEVILYHLTSLLGFRGRESLPVRKGPFQLRTV